MAIALPSEAETWSEQGASAETRPAHKYWGFLSYSHEDRGVAAWLHRALETYPIPRRLVGRGSPAGSIPPRLRPIFRDRDELRAGADLGERLRGALDASAFLIVICSPAAAGSRWVNEEIAWFRDRHGPERVLAVIASGEPFAFGGHDPDQECFPPALRRSGSVQEAADHEPAAADLRRKGDGRRRALLKLIAGMLDVDLDELIRRDLQHRNRQLVALSSASVGVAALTASLAVVAATQRDRALYERNQAEGLIQFMIGDLDKRLEPLGQLSVLDAIGKRAMAYYAAEGTGALDVAELSRRARVLQLVGEVQERRGDLVAATRSFEESEASTAELLRRSPRDPRLVFDEAQSQFYLGQSGLDRNDDRAALRGLEAYRRLADRLVQLTPGDPGSWAEVEEADLDVGAERVRTGDPEAAVARLSQALPIGTRLAAEQPRSRDRAWDLAQIYAWLADAESAEGDIGAALAHRSEEAAIFQRLIARTPSDSEFAVALANSRMHTASLQIRRGAVAAGAQELQDAMGDLDRLIAASPDNTSFKRTAAPGFVLLAATLLREGRLEAARLAARRALELSATFARRGYDRAGEVLLTRIAAATARTPAQQQRALEPARDEAERLVRDTVDHGPVLSQYRAEALLLAGDLARSSGRSAEASAHWRAAAAQATDVVAMRQPVLEPIEGLIQQLRARLGPGGPPRRSGREGLVDYRW